MNISFPPKPKPTPKVDAIQQKVFQTKCGWEDAACLLYSLACDMERDLETLKSITPPPPNAITFEQGCKILDFVQSMLYPKPSPPAFIHYSGCPATKGQPICTCVVRSA